MKRRLLVLAMSFVMVFTMMPMMSGAIFAADEDTRTPVNAVTATTPSGSIPPAYGATVSKLIFTSEQADFPVTMGDWQKKVENEWVDVETGTTFTEGTYRYEAQVRIDEISPLSGNEYVIGNPCTVTVNGVSWSTLTEITSWPGFSYDWTYSPEYTIERPVGAPLEIRPYTKSISSNANIAIDQIKLLSLVSGGVGQYTFTKTSGPIWLNVSSNGLITGTPTSVGTNDNLVVRVTDEEQHYQEITITVANTKMNPADRTLVSSVTGTTQAGTIKPKYGDTVGALTITSNVNFSFNSGDWYKKVENDWVSVSNGDTFGEGTYKYEIQVRIDEDSILPGDEYVLSENCTVTVDGETWTTITAPSVGPGFSYGWSTSPEYVVINPTNLEDGQVTVNEASIKYDGTAKEPAVTVRDLDGDVLTLGTDYTVSYSNNINPGTGKATVTGMGRYHGTKEATFTINPAGLKSAVLSQTSFTYDSMTWEPEVTVVGTDNKELVKDVDYAVTYSNNRNIGTATATVTGIGNYSFTKKLTFTIKALNLAATSKVAVALYGYDDVKVSWNPVSGASGYAVYYKKSTSSTWSGPKYTTSTSYKIANLADGAMYYFRVYPCVKDENKYHRDGSYKNSSAIYTLKKISGVKAVRSGTKVKVSWSNISGESGYQISRSTKKTGTSIVKTYSTTSGKYYSVSATKGKTYYYKVRAYKTVSGKKIYGPWSTVYKYRR